MAPRQQIFYTKQNMEAAIRAHKEDGKGIRVAAKLHGVPVSTLSDRLRGRKPRDECERTILKKEDEKKLTDWIKESTQCGIAPTMQQIQDQAQAILNDKGVETIFKGNRPGRTWKTLFAKRHKDLLLKKPQPPPSSPPIAKPSIPLPPLSPSSFCTPSTSAAPPVSDSDSSILGFSAMQPLHALDTLVNVCASLGIERIVRCKAFRALDKKTEDPQEILFLNLYERLAMQLVSGSANSVSSQHISPTSDNVSFPIAKKSKSSCMPSKMASFQMCRDFINERELKKEMEEEDENHEQVESHERKRKRKDENKKKGQERERNNMLKDKNNEVVKGGKTTKRRKKNRVIDVPDVDSNLEIDFDMTAVGEVVWS